MNVNLNHLLMIVTVENEKAGRRCVHWMTTNDEKRFLSFAQYLIDGSSHPEDFIVFDMTDKSEFNLADYCLNTLGMHKRTFEERMAS